MAIYRNPTRPRRLDRQADHLARFRADVVAGLSESPKTLLCKYFYDELGSKLFDEICDLAEYYVTRTELAIMHAHAGEMADRLGRDCKVIEFGSGSSIKTRLLLEQLAGQVGYVPVDISREHLLASAKRLQGAFPHVEVAPVAADFTAPFDLPAMRMGEARSVVYFPGSTIGNFTPSEAGRLLGQIAELVRPDGGLLIGIDLQKDPAVLERAYDDRWGVTAAFNLNLLARINRELGADFDVEAFQHEARYNHDLHCIEMHLACTDTHTVHVDGRAFTIAAGETIHTENSHKYSIERFSELAAAAGLRLVQTWTDEREYFGVLYFTA